MFFIKAINTKLIRYINYREIMYKVATALENKTLSAGVQTIELNTAELNAGCYTYKINSNTASKAGILSIVK
ncbi:MAG: hypothetical protein JSU07_04670 [Bacteroidetes bacterium]|nr:hypothetical protein [Bacteroidota bacterium]